MPSAQSTLSLVESTAGAGRTRTFSFTLVVLHCPYLDYLRVLRALLPFLTLIPISSSIHSFQCPLSLLRHSISRPLLHSSSECLASNTPCKTSFDQSSSPLHKTPRTGVSLTHFFTFILQVTYVRLRVFFHTLVHAWLDRLQFWDWRWWHPTFFPWPRRLSFFLGTLVFCWLDQLVLGLILMVLPGWRWWYLAFFPWHRPSVFFPWGHTLVFW